VNDSVQIVVSAEVSSHSVIYITIYNSLLWEYVVVGVVVEVEVLAVVADVAGIIVNVLCIV